MHRIQNLVVALSTATLIAVVGCGDSGDSLSNDDGQTINDPVDNENQTPGEGASPGNDTDPGDGTDPDSGGDIGGDADPGDGNGTPDPGDGGGTPDPGDGGGNAEDPDSAFYTGLPSDIILANVTVQERQTICDTYNQTQTNFANTYWTGVCAVEGALSNAVLRSVNGCERDRNDCLSRGPSAELIVCDATIIPAQCQATIGELETCYSDSLISGAALMEQYANQSCEELFENDVPDPSPSCAVIEAKCPGLETGLGDLEDEEEDEDEDER